MGMLHMRNWMSLVVLAVTVSAGLFGCASDTSPSIRTPENMHQAIVQKDIAALAVNLQALQRIRQGRVDEAASLLETTLDSQIISLYHESAEHEYLQHVVKRLLQGAREYRRKHPEGSTVNSPVVKKMVDEILEQHLPGDI